MNGLPSTITLTDVAAVRRYIVELAAYRAEGVRMILDEVIQGSAFHTHAPVESFSLVYQNPPYDFEIGEGQNDNRQARGGIRLHRRLGCHLRPRTRFDLSA